MLPNTLLQRWPLGELRSGGILGPKPGVVSFPPAPVRPLQTVVTGLRSVAWQQQPVPLTPVGQWGSGSRRQATNRLQTVTEVKAEEQVLTDVCMVNRKRLTLEGSHFVHFRLVLPDRLGTQMMRDCTLCMFCLLNTFHLIHQ